MAADIVGFDLEQFGFAGGECDPLAALVLCAPVYADLSIIHGRIVVREGQLTTIDLPSIVARHRALARTLVNGN